MQQSVINVMHGQDFQVDFVENLTLFGRKMWLLSQKSLFEILHILSHDSKKITILRVIPAGIEHQAGNSQGFEAI